jgi:PKD domain
MRLKAALWLAFVAMAVAPGNAVGAPQWLGSVPLTEPGELNQRPQVAFDGQSDVIAAWTRAKCSSINGMLSCSNPRVQAAIKPPGQPFGAPQTIPGDPGAARVGGETPVGADAQGGAVAAWVSFENGISQVRYALRAPGQPFGATQTITGIPPGESADTPVVAVDPLGNMVAVWLSTPDGSTFTARYALGTTTLGFGPSQPMPGDAGASPTSEPQVAFDGLGNIIAVWGKLNGGMMARAQVAIGNMGGFAAAEQIDDDANAFDSGFTLDTDSQGNAALMLESQVFMGADQFEYALKPPGLPFGELESFDGQSGVPRTSAVAVGPGGRAFAIWSYDNGQTDRALRFAVREPGLRFGPAQPMPADGGEEPGSPDVVFDGKGNAIAVWNSFEPGGTGVAHIRWSVAPAGQAFTTAATLLGPEQGAELPHVAVDPQGNAVATWMGRPPSTAPDLDVPVMAAGYDAAGPFLRDLSMPTIGNTARPVAFSLNPVDVWSPPVTTRLTFGDGQATTAAVSIPHRYRKAGRFDVSLTATDAVGNASTAAGSVQIADKTAPVISRLSMTRRRFVVGPKRTARRAAKRRKPGSAFRYRLSERANVSIKIARVLPGRRVGRRCRRPTGKLLRRPRCKRFVAVGTLTRRNRRAGRNVVAFSGRIGKRALKPGTYRASLTAVDRARNRSKPRRITFRIAA